jgi:hypothetical protein
MALLVCQAAIVVDNKAVVVIALCATCKLTRVCVIYTKVAIGMALLVCRAAIVVDNKTEVVVRIQTVISLLHLEVT